MGSSLEIALYRHNCNEWIEDNLQEVIHQQELKLGLEHNGIPKVICKLTPQQKEQHADGAYDPTTNTISLDAERIFSFEPGLPRLAMFIETTTNYGNLFDPWGTVQHELGHFYADKVHEEYGSGNWPNRPRY